MPENSSTEETGGALESFSAIPDRDQSDAEASGFAVFVPAGVSLGGGGAKVSGI